MMNCQLGQARNAAPFTAAPGRGRVAAVAARSTRRTSGVAASFPGSRFRGGSDAGRASTLAAGVASPAADLTGSANPNQPPPLVIGTAMNHLTTAIQAYAEPLTGIEFSCRGENGTLTQFLCPDFVQDKFKALLQVKVKNAIGFDNADRFTKPDLYVRLSAGDSFAQTDTIKDTQNPEWNETFYMWPEQYGEADLFGDVSTAPPVLKVVVLDEDWRLGRKVEEYLGAGEMTLPDDWETMDDTDYTVDVKDKDGQVIGQVNLAIDAFTFTEAAKQEGVRKADGEAGEASSVAAAAFASMKPKQGMRPGDSAELAASVAAAAVVDPGMADRMASTADDTGDATIVPMEAHASSAGDAFAAREQNKMRKQLYEAWEALGKAFPDQFVSEGEPVAFICAKYTTDAQAFVHRNMRLKQIVVAFRGSQTIEDWTTDGSFSMEPITADPVTGALRTPEDDGSLPDRGGVMRELRKLVPTKDASVHVGFYYSMRSVEPQIREVVDMLTGGDPDWTVTLTGHSLGAALATVCAFSLGRSNNFNYKLECYPFGSPRVGNLAFVEQYNQAVPRTFQFQVDNDLVAQLPPFLGYKDVSNECRVLAGGRLELPPDIPVSVFGRRPITDTMREKLVEQLTDADARNKKALSEADGQFFQALMSMEGGKPHLPDTYLKALAEVMVTASSGERYVEVDAVQKMRDAFVALGKSK